MPKTAGDLKRPPEGNPAVQNQREVSALEFFVPLDRSCGGARDGRAARHGVCAVQPGQCRVLGRNLRSAFGGTAGAQFMELLDSHHELQKDPNPMNRDDTAGESGDDDGS